MIHVVSAVIVALCTVVYMFRVLAGWEPSNQDIMLVLCWIMLWVLSVAISPHIKELSTLRTRKGMLRSRNNAVVPQHPFAGRCTK